MTPHDRLRFTGALALLGVAMVLVMNCTSCASSPSPTTTPRSPSPVALPELYFPAVTLLTLSADGAPVGRCTAWKLGDDLVATAGHCCEAGYSYSLRSAPPGAAAPVALVDDDVHDVCVLRGEMAGDPIVLAPEDPAIGAPVWTAGYPNGWFLISAGFWSGRDDDDEGVCSVVVAGGASGSPILDARGRAVGVLIKRISGMDSLALVSTIEWLTTARDFALRLRDTAPVHLTRPEPPTPSLFDGPGGTFGGGIRRGF